MPVPQNLGGGGGGDSIPSTLQGGVCASILMVASMCIDLLGSQTSITGITSCVLP